MKFHQQFVATRTMMLSLSLLAGGVTAGCRSSSPSTVEEAASPSARAGKSLQQIEANNARSDGPATQQRDAP
ncbi:MAG: hypothetical protein KDC14_15755, partial [Planctomycetes bacterium]|nr:hypothetical protein [Planctomycetota bacterium]